MDFNTQQMWAVIECDFFKALFSAHVLILKPQEGEPQMWCFQLLMLLDDKNF